MSRVDFDQLKASLESRVRSIAEVALNDKKERLTKERNKALEERKREYNRLPGEFAAKIKG